LKHHCGEKEGRLMLSVLWSTISFYRKMWKWVHRILFWLHKLVCPRKKVAKNKEKSMQH
jgi:hypothetical protein